MPEPSVRSLVVECVALFVVVPAAVAWWAWGRAGGVSALPFLWILAAAIAFALTRDRSYSWRAEVATHACRGERLQAFIRIGIASGLLFSWTAQFGVRFAIGGYRGSFELLELPRESPGLWLVFLVAYPIISVVPQEIVYRTFFFRRYERVFGDLTEYASAAAFCLAHLLFWNFVAAGLSLVGGVLLARTYERTRSLKLVVLEHVIYGELVLTLGFGPFFGGGTLDLIGL